VLGWGYVNGMKWVAMVDPNAHDIKSKYGVNIMKSTLLTKLVIGLVIFLVSQAAVAAETSEGNEKLYIVGVVSNHPTAVYMRCKADYIAFPVIIRDDPKVKERVKKIYFRQQVATSLMAGAKKSKSPLKVRFTGFSKEPYLYLMIPIGGANQDVGAYTKKIETLFKSILFAGKSKCELGDPALAIENPEKYRVPLIAKIVESFEKLSVTLQSPVRINIEGLEKAVEVTVDDDEYLNLHIPYTLGIEIIRGKK
jgi:hypothetical protein